MRSLIPALAAIVIAAPAAAQQAPVDGTYVPDGGSYSIRVRQLGDRLEVREPGRVVIYTGQIDGSYRSDGDTPTRLRIVDGATIETTPLAAGGTPTRFKRVGPAATIRAIDIPASSATGEPALPPPGTMPDAAPPPLEAPPVTAERLPRRPLRSAGGAMGAAADRYLAQVRQHPEDAPIWALCSASAIKRGAGDSRAADAYATEAVAALRAIMDVPQASPCADAIPPAIWDEARGSGQEDGEGPHAPEEPLSPDEEARLRQLNQQADARARVAAERREADIRAQAERDAAYREQQAQYERDRAAYEAQRRADDEAYRRDLDAYDQSGGRPPR